MTSSATCLTNWSNRAGGKVGPVTGIAGSMAGEDGPERGTDDRGAGSLSLLLECKL